MNGGPSGEISTFGWDTAFAVRIENVNAAIKARQASPKSFQYVDPLDDQVTCSGQFGDWEIVRGGDGGGVNVCLPMTAVSGRARSGTAYAGYTWPGGTMTFTIRLAFFEGTGSASALKVQATSDEPSVPVAEYYSTTQPVAPDPPWAIYALQSAVTGWCNANLADFAHVFAVADLNDEADTGAWAFLKPTAVSYSYVDGATDADAFLGVLAMTQGKSPDGLQQVIDERIVQAGEEGAFCISRTLLLEKLILPNLVAQWPNLQTSQVTVSEQEIQLLPNQTVDLPQVTYNNEQYTPSLTQFSFTIEGSQITVQAHTETVVQDGVTAWCDTTALYTIVKGTNKSGQTTLLFQAVGTPTTSHGHSIAEWVKIIDAILALVAAVALAALAVATGGAAALVIGVVGALLVGVIGLSAEISGLIENGDSPAIDLMQENIYNPMVWTDSQDFTVVSVDLDGSIRLGGSLGFGTT